MSEQIKQFYCPKCNKQYDCDELRVPFPPYGPFDKICNKCGEKVIRQ